MALLCEYENDTVLAAATGKSACGGGLNMAAIKTILATNGQPTGGRSAEIRARLQRVLNGDVNLAGAA